MRGVASSNQMERKVRRIEKGRSSPLELVATGIGLIVWVRRNFGDRLEWIGGIFASHCKNLIEKCTETVRGVNFKKYGSLV